MTYIDLDSGNGGIILNISEGGLAVQAARALIEDDLPCLRFRFSHSENWITEKGVIAWKSKSKKMAGVQFVDLSERSRIQISKWISTGASRNKADQGKDRSVAVQALPGAPSRDNEKDPLQEPGKREHAEKNQYMNSVPASATTASYSGELAGAIDASAVRVGNAPDESIPEPDTRSTQSALIQSPSEPRKPEILRSRRASGPRSLLKRYLVDERHRIRLHDLVFEETEKLYSQLTEANFPTNVPVTDEEFIKRVHRYEELTEELVSIISIGCFWGEKNQEFLWAKLLERIANAAGPRHPSSPWVSLQSYPALLLLYAGGVAAIASEKYTALEALLIKPKLIAPNGDCRLIDGLSVAAVIEDERLSQILAGGGAQNGPLSTYLCGLLRERFRELVPSDHVYDEIFDRFEYLFALVWIDEGPIVARQDCIPLGRFAWRELSILQGGASIEGKMGAEVSQQGKEWPAFRAGLFGGSTQRFLSARNRVATIIGSQQNRLR
jgi:PilZ domain